MIVETHRPPIHTRYQGTIKRGKIVVVTAIAVQAVWVIIVLLVGRLM